jgi:hypothetical protein
MGNEVGAAASGLGAGQAKERTDENTFGMNQNNAETQRYGIQQNARNDLLSMLEKAGLDRAKLGMESDAQRGNQMIRGSLLANVQPAKLSHPRANIPQMSGGLTPAALSPMARQAGSLLQTKAMGALESGSDIPAMPDFKGGEITPPAVREFKDAGTGESILSGLGATAGLLPGILAAIQKQGEGGLRTPDWNPNMRPQSSMPVAGIGPEQPFPGWAPQTAPRTVGTDTTGWKGWG